MEIKSIYDFVAKSVTSYLERSDKIMDQIVVCDKCDTVLFIKAESHNGKVRQERVYRKCWYNRCYAYLCALCEGNDNPFFSGDGDTLYCSQKCRIDDY